MLMALAQGQRTAEWKRQPYLFCRNDPIKSLDATSGSTGIPHVDTKTPAGFMIQGAGNNNKYDVTVIHN